MNYFRICPEQPYKHQIKIMILGERCSGKTCLLEKLAGRTAPVDYTPTMKIEPVDIYYKSLSYIVKLQVLDFHPDMLKFTTVGGIHRGTRIYIITADISRADCVELLEDEIDRLNLYIDKSARRIIVGTKIDLALDGIEAEVIRYCEWYKLDYLVDMHTLKETVCSSFVHNKIQTNYSSQLSEYIENLI